MRRLAKASLKVAEREVRSSDVCLRCASSETERDGTDESMDGGGSALSELWFTGVSAHSFAKIKQSMETLTYVSISLSPLHFPKSPSHSSNCCSDLTSERTRFLSTVYIVAWTNMQTTRVDIVDRSRRVERCHASPIRQLDVEIVVVVL